jgi:hypothetical protein
VRPPTTLVQNFQPLMRDRNKLGISSVIEIFRARNVRPDISMEPVFKSWGCRVGELVAIRIRVLFDYLGENQTLLCIPCSVAFHGRMAIFMKLCQIYSAEIHLPENAPCSFNQSSYPLYMTLVAIKIPCPPPITPNTSLVTQTHPSASLPKLMLSKQVAALLSSEFHLVPHCSQD